MGASHDETISLRTLDRSEGSGTMSSSIYIIASALQSSSETYIGEKEETPKDASATVAPTEALVSSKEIQATLLALPPFLGSIQKKKSKLWIAFNQ